MIILIIDCNYVCNPNLKNNHNTKFTPSKCHTTHWLYICICHIFNFASYLILCVYLFIWVVYCKLLTNGKQLPAFHLRPCGNQTPASEVGGESVTTLPPWPLFNCVCEFTIDLLLDPQKQSLFPSKLIFLKTAEVFEKP